MKFGLPENHGLSTQIVDALVFYEEETPSLTDSQYAALEAGVGRGESMLVVSPTSTGKTQLALWAIASGLEDGANTVYLVTHRALAKQKFADFSELLAQSFLGSDRRQLVLATGDEVANAAGEKPADPLQAQILVATYEKYLAMLSASGVPTSLNQSVIVCDEIQLLGDASRGRNVEVLLTLLKNAGWRQFVGLSAVLEKTDSLDLASWLSIKLVRETQREKHLEYEYWSPTGAEIVFTGDPGSVNRASLPSGAALDTLGVVNYITTQCKNLLPIIVFCMRKQDIYDLAEKELELRKNAQGAQLSFDLGELPPTSAKTFLSTALGHRLAIHSADLTEEERRLVEEELLAGNIDVVFATSTLAAGVNFPLGAAVFNTWARWDGDFQKYMPIEPSEFHNMCGRVGRMGTHHDAGKIIYLPDNRMPRLAYQRYLDLTSMPQIISRIEPKIFDQLALQLIAAGLCNSYDTVVDLICSSFSGLREEDHNLSAFEDWPRHIGNAIEYLGTVNLIVRLSDGTLVASPVGKAASHSGLQPVSAVSLLNYFVDKGPALAALLSEQTSLPNLDRFAFLVFSAAFSSPEFRTFRGSQPPRHLPWPLQDVPFDASEYADDLYEPNWYGDLIPVNCARLALQWIRGESIGELEKEHSALRAGMLLDLYRNLGWALQGIASILSAASDPRTPAPLRPERLRDDPELLRSLRKLPRMITRLSARVGAGLPDDVLWMNALNGPEQPFKLVRDEIIGLSQRGYTRPEQLMLGSTEADSIRADVFARAKPKPIVKSNWLRDRCRSWKSDQRRSAAARQEERARRCPEVGLIREFYESRQEKFEAVFESVLTYLSINYTRLDDGGAIGAPDYLVDLDNSPPLIIELKSKNNNSLVNYNEATEVLSASEIHGYRDAFCVTLCHPGVDPSVPTAITACGRLSVVESSDLGEALLRICQKRLTQPQLWEWLATPGQALSLDLPFVEYS